MVFLSSSRLSILIELICSDRLTVCSRFSHINNSSANVACFILPAALTLGDNLKTNVEVETSCPLKSDKSAFIPGRGFLLICSSPKWVIILFSSYKGT